MEVQHINIYIKRSWYSLESFNSTVFSFQQEKKVSFPDPYKASLLQRISVVGKLFNENLVLSNKLIDKG